jgi:hypothetical protein
MEFDNIETITAPAPGPPRGGPVARFTVALARANRSPARGF